MVMLGFVLINGLCLYHRYTALLLIVTSGLMGYYVIGHIKLGLRRSEVPNDGFWILFILASFAVVDGFWMRMVLVFGLVGFVVVADQRGRGLEMDQSGHRLLGFLVSVLCYLMVGVGYGLALFD